MADPIQPYRDIVTAAGMPGAASDANAGLGRLVAVVIGIDHYAQPGIPDLTCAVNDAESLAGAIRRTQPPDALDLTVLVGRADAPQAVRPTRPNVLDAMRRAAQIAGAADTVLVSFAGHGGIVERAPCLFPADTEIVTCGSETSLRSVIRVEEIQALFEQSPCCRRVMFLDCCQNAFRAAAEGDAGSTAPPAASRGLPWRTGLPVSDEMVNSLQQLPKGWSILLSCGPNELSLEDPEWGQHGIFSHFLAVGLQGRADLDGDGVVSLAELSQFLANRVSKQAEAVADSIPRAQRAAGPCRQTPTLIWGGPAAFPLTRSVAEGRAGLQSRLFALWRKYLFGRLPYPMVVEGMARYGTAAIYGMVMATTVLLFAPAVGPAEWSALAGVLGLGSAACWIATFALAAAANETRWHTGGYITGCITLAWCLAVFAFLVLFREYRQGDAVPWPPVFQLGAELLVLASLLVVFGHNAVQGIIALGDMVRKDLRVPGRRAFRYLDQHWIHAEIDNVIAMVSGHPSLYQLVGLGCCGFALVHATFTLILAPLAAVTALHVLRDFMLMLLIQWQVQWYAASYRLLRGIMLPER